MLAVLEKKNADLLPQQRQDASQLWEEPLSDIYWVWVDGLNPEPGSKLKDAANYARSQKQHLNEFLNHGEVDYTNNNAENAIRLFCRGQGELTVLRYCQGIRVQCIMYTMVETAKANGLEA